MSSQQMYRNDVPLRLCREVLAYLTALRRPELDGFISDLIAAVHAAERNDLPFRSLAVPPTRGLSNLSRAVTRARHDLPLWKEGAAGRRLLDVAASTAGWAAWTEFYREDEWSRPFVHRFAGGTVVGPSAPWQAEHLIVDLFVYGPDIDYPAHAHPAEEVYLILGGDAHFRVGKEPEYRRLHPGEVSHHQPDEPHAIRAGSEAILGVVMYRGDLAGPLWYRDNMEDPEEPRKNPGVVRPEPVEGSTLQRRDT
ncbi:MAG: dimethylsulfonioproprionate lyase family protein [Spirochaetota bacterium]